MIATGSGHLRAVWEISLFFCCFLCLLLKVPASVMSKYYPWKFNVVTRLLISFHLLPLNFQAFVESLELIIPFCFLLKSTRRDVREVLSSKGVILQFRDPDPIGVYGFLNGRSNS